LGDGCTGPSKQGKVFRCDSAWYDVAQ
jgi:hypothetical protein